jgi:NodT family efflux transporter outer membrane factor (OMF) lipoprotein
VGRSAFSRRQVCAPAVALIIGSTLYGCTVGPNYVRDPAPVPTDYKEAKGALKGWKRADPRDDVDRGDWWMVYHDRGLNELMPLVEVSNQTVAASAAAYEEARAIVREAQAALLPTASGTYNVTRTRTGPTANPTATITTIPPHAIYQTTYTIPVTGTWDLDVWGKLRRQLESDTAAAQASAADLDNAKLAAQALLATAYFNLRTADSLIDLLQHTVVEYKKTLTIVENQFKAGYSVTAGDVATARAMVETTQAQLESTRVTRAQDEHAIAVLIGRPPAELTVGRRLLLGTTPRTPLSLPSTLLERRPDIAAAERTMQQDNALIGVAEAAYFPDISLSAMIEPIGPIPLPITAARTISSITGTATQTLFDGGTIAAQVDAARAAYWQSVANYRQTVLTAFQQVEDELAGLNYFRLALARQENAVKDQRTAVQVYLNQFQAGTVAFTTVVTAEITLLADEEIELTYRQDLFLASVALIDALGGGWDTTLVPDQMQLHKGYSLVPKYESRVPLAVELVPTIQSPANPQTLPPPDVH